MCTGQSAQELSVLVGQLQAVENSFKDCSNDQILPPRPFREVDYDDLVAYLRQYGEFRWFKSYQKCLVIYRSAEDNYSGQEVSRVTSGNYVVQCDGEDRDLVSRWKDSLAAQARSAIRKTKTKQIPP
jgi:hypothetical protein